jgi:hypothetical protein
MTSAETPATETISTGGFRIEISASDIRVTADETAFDRIEKSARRRIFTLVFCGVLIAAILLTIVMIPSYGDLELLLVMLLIVGISVLFRSFQGRNDIYCTRDTFQVIHVKYGKTAASWNFPRSEMGPIQFTVFSSGRYGTTCGLAFTVQSKKVKVLSGLKVVEAQKILIELGRLGFEAPRDVAMPMMVEIEMERRGSLLG